METREKPISSKGEPIEIKILRALQDIEANLINLRYTTVNYHGRIDVAPVAENLREIKYKVEVLENLLSN